MNVHGDKPDNRDDRAWYVRVEKKKGIFSGQHYTRYLGYEIVDRNAFPKLTLHFEGGDLEVCDSEWGDLLAST